MPLTRIDSAFLDLDAIGGIDFDVQSGVPTFSVDAVNHQVGIGTDSPTTKLEVIGDITVSKQNAFIELKDPDTADANYRLRNQGGSFSIYDVTNNQVKIAATAGGVTIYPNLNANNGLDVMGTITGDGNLDIADGIRHYGDTNTAIRFPATDRFAVETAGIEALRVDGNQRVGIGTDDLQARFTVYSADNNVYGREIRIDASDAPSGSVGVGIFKILGDGNSLGKYIIGYNSTHPSQANDVSLKNSDGDISFHTAVNATPAEKVRITTTGRVGINEPNPAYTLDLGESASTIRLVSENNGTAIRVGAGGGSNDVTLIRVDGDANNNNGESDSAQYGFSLKYLGSGSQNANAFAIFSDNQAGTQVQAFTILQDGSVGIGENNPSAILHVKKAGDPNVIQENSANNSLDRNNTYSFQFSDGEGAFVKATRPPNGSASDTYLAFGSGGSTERLRINSDGKINVGGSTGAIGTKFNVFNGSDNQNILGITGADESSEYAAIGVNSGNAVITGGGVGTTSTGIIFRTAASGAETERLRITSDGKFGFGTGGNIDERGHIETASGNCRLKLQTGNTAVAGFVLQTSAKRFDIQAQNNFFQLYDSTVGTDRIRITSAGNVGIGIFDRECKLQVGGDLQVGDSNVPGTFINVVGAGVGQNFGIRFGGGSNNPESKFSILGNTNHSNMMIRFGGTERVRITSAGRIGIGTNNPSTIAHMYGSSGLYTRFEQVDGKKVNFGISNGDGIIDITGANPLRVLVNNGSERLRITSSGNVGIGTNNPVYPLHVQESAYFRRGIQVAVLSSNELQSRSPINSGFYNVDNTTTANGWPFTGWAHLLANTHSNTTNYYSQQFASSFYNQELYFRNTNNGSTTTSQSWGQVMHTNSALKPVFAESSGVTDAYSRYWYPGGEYYVSVHGITAPGDANNMIEQGYYHIANNTSNNPTSAYGYLNVHRHAGSQYSLQHFIVSSDTGRQWMRASYPDGSQSSGRNWYQWYSYGALERENTFTNRQHLIGPSSTSTFTGLHANTSNNRAQFVLHSDYSDLVISSSQNNNNHGSTLSFVTSNPSNSANYSKFVINKGNYGTRNQFLEFGFRTTAHTNPHDYVNTTYTMLTLDGSNQRVGIGAGARTPSYPLDVRFAGDSGIHASSSNSHCSLFLNASTGNGSYIRMSAGGNQKFWIATDGSGHLNFRPNAGGTTIRMQNGGKLDAFAGIYVSGASLTLANTELDFTTANHKYIDFYTNNGNTVNFRMPNNSNVFHTGIQMVKAGAVNLYHNNTVKFYTTSTGTFTNGLQGSSDARLKTNVITVPNALDKVRAMRGVKFNWIEDGRADYGVIAQEAETVVPELVGDHETKKLTQAGSLKKRPDDSDYITTTEKGFSYMSMVGILIEAIKEQQSTIDSLTARIDALENP